MKTLFSVIFTTAFAFLLIAPTPSLAQNSPDLECSAPQWRYLQDGYFAKNTHASVGGTDRGYAANYPPLYEVSALFRNAGQKAVKSVTWNYLFYKDEPQTEVLYSHSFNSSKGIEPGESVRLKEYLIASMGNGPQQFTNYQAVHISRIKYADGTFWQAAKVKK